MKRLSPEDKLKARRAGQAEWMRKKRREQEKAEGRKRCPACGQLLPKGKDK